MVKPRKHVSPRLMNSMLVGITRRNSDFRRISECDASVDRVPGNNEIDIQMSFDGSMQEELFDDQYVQKTLGPRDVMDQQGDSQIPAGRAISTEGGMAVHRGDDT